MHIGSSDSRLIDEAVITSFFEEHPIFLFKNPLRLTGVQKPSRGLDRSRADSETKTADSETNRAAAKAAAISQSWLAANHD